METTYIKPPMFELNEVTGTYNATEALTPENIFSMVKYLLEPSIKDKVIQDTYDAQDFLVTELGSEDREIFACLFLGVKCEVISFEKLFFGTIGGSRIYPNVVVKRALLLNASSVICVHNHPSRDTTPSLADMHITDHLRKSLALIEVKLIDHFIIGGSRILSMKRDGFEHLFN